MFLSDFAYELPSELIAQEPALERSSSRLLAVDRPSRHLYHYQFSKIVHLLSEGCLLVLNDTRVFPARLRGHKESGGRLELLLLRRLPGEDVVWEAMCKGGQNVKMGTRVEFSPDLSGIWLSAPSGQPESSLLKVSFSPPVAGCVNFDQKNEDESKYPVESDVNFPMKIDGIQFIKVIKLAD